MRRATSSDTGPRQRGPISIHALLAESDQYWATRARAAQLFLSTLSLRRATGVAISRTVISLFLSTLSLRRATRGIPKVFSSLGYFYPRSPCGERPIANTGATKSGHISIHALLAESDAAIWYTSTPWMAFLSTLSLRRATFSVFASPFSIFYFYPRSPCGERLYKRGEFNRDNRFLSTLSLRRATNSVCHS